MRYGQKWLGKHRKMGSTYCAQCCPVFISSKNSVKIWPKKKLLRHRRCNALQWGSNSHFSQKNAFFGQKMTFFWKIHFIQNSSATKNTSYAHFGKKIFLLKSWFCIFHRIQPSDNCFRILSFVINFVLLSGVYVINCIKL